VPKAPPFIGPSAVDVALEVNGDRVSVHVPPNRTLLDTLRETLGLTGAKRVCDEGTCGACTVLLDGEPVYSCMTLAVACEGKSVRTVEGLSQEAGVGAPESGARLHPVQEAFIEHDAFQCGFCTPGQIMSVVALLERVPRPTSEDVLRAVSGNLCRCGAYPNIVAAALSAAKSGSGR
jgi:xanthine dehydrogenase YagT iron-sulfur-binding subunit